MDGLQRYTGSWTMCIAYDWTGISLHGTQYGMDNRSGVTTLSAWLHQFITVNGSQLGDMHTRHGLSGINIGMGEIEPNRVDLVQMSDER